ncbi:MAG: hypothetical protein CM15mP106_5770 [Candidatus Neomarinimicrobiota bacterium]|nr:MAG: hypothetical protein CM15mP106_5770 [Candidatus Neomarinimicrobiota bacterium]
MEFWEVWGLKQDRFHAINWQYNIEEKIDQDYPLFFLYNKSNIPGRPESIGKITGALSNRFENIEI